MASSGIQKGPEESKPVVPPADIEAIQAQIQRVIVDPLFTGGKRANLLKFITNRSLEGRSEDLKERIIGIEVFGRSPDYDTNLDSTVRVAVTELRKRLAQYYSQPGCDRELRIEVPVGAYLAKFRLPDQTFPKPQTRPKPRLPGYLAGACGVAILALATWGLLRLVSIPPPIEQFWAPLLSRSGPVAFYPPFSSALPSAQTFSPSDPANSGALLYQFLKHRGQVPVNDVTAISSLIVFVRQKGKESAVRPVSGADLSTLRSAPGVLVGSFNNDWVIRLGEGLHFRFRRESELGLRWIEDSTDSQNKNWAVDYSAPYRHVTEDYALISRVLDPNTGQWLITIGGLTGLATAAACEFVTNANAMASLGAGLPKGWASKNLQIILAVKLIEGSPGAPQVVARYLW